MLAKTVSCDMFLVLNQLLWFGQYRTTVIHTNDSWNRPHGCWKVACMMEDIAN